MAVGLSQRAPLVLLHAGPPWQTNGGAVFLDAIAATTERPCVHLFISLEGRAVPVPAEFPRPVWQVTARQGICGMGVLQRGAPWLARQLYWGAVYPLVLDRRTAAVETVIGSLAPHRLLVFLNAVEVPAVAASLAARLGLPYATMEWDLLDVAVDRLQLVGPLHRRAIENLAALRAGAVARAVASEGMAGYYRGELGLDALVLRQPATRVVDRRERDLHGPFVIAVCGNVYAGAEFRALLSALDRLGWTAAGRTIALRVIGELAPDVGPVPEQVQVTGWLPYEESLRRLSEADLGYCPYWFDSERSRIVSTSFPSKLIAYLSCGVPVFYHGPIEGTPTAFLARFPAGVACHTLDPAGIAAALAGVVADPILLASARKAGAAAMSSELSTGTFRDRVVSWVGDEPIEAAA